MKRFAIYLLEVSVSLCGWAQTPDWNRAEKLSADTLEQYMSGRYIYPTWIEGSSSFYYDVKKWDGAVELYDMFRLTDELKKEEVLRKYIPNYRINLIDAANIEHIHGKRCV